MNPYDSSAYIELIQFLRKFGDLDGFRRARDRFISLLYPSLKDWISWIEDECSMITNAEDERTVKHLFEQALTDYPVSVELWMKYLGFCESSQSFKIDCESESKRAAAFAGWSLKNGRSIFEHFRMPLNPSIPFGQPEFEAFEAVFPQNLQQYLNTIKASKKLNSADKLTFSRSLFERALEICGNREFVLWEEYLNFLRLEMNVSSVILGVSKRLTRTHPLNPSSWIILMENLEAFNKAAEIENQLWPNELPQMLLQCNLEYFVSLQLARFDALRRSASKDLQGKLLTAIYDEETCFFDSSKGYSDPQARLLRYYSKVLLAVGDLDKFRSVWQQQILKHHAKEAAFWLEYIQLEKSLQGNAELVSNAFKKAAAAVSDYPETVFYEWIQFEREYGSSIHSLFEARDRIKKQKMLIKDREQQKALKEQKPQKSKRQRVEETVKSSQREETEDSEQQRVRFDPEATVFVNNLPFKFSESDIKNHFNTLLSELPEFSPEKSVKSIRMHMNSSGKAFKGHATVEFDSVETAALVLEKLNRIPADDSGRPVFLAKYVSPLEQKRTSISPRSSEESDARTLYVSNLPTKDSKAVEELFKSLAGIRQIRHVDGKQFAYIEFEDERWAAAGLKEIPEIEESIKAAFSNPPKNKTEPPKPIKPVLLKPRSVVIRKS